MFQVHKPGQAKASRTVTFICVILLVVWGCRSMLYALPVLWRTLGLAWNEILQDARPGDAWTADLVLVQTKFSPALTISVLVLAAAALWCFRLLNRPKVADALIDMEAELRKVSWPSFSDAWQSTLVVSGFTALIVVLVFGYDLVIKAVMHVMPTGRI